MKVCMCRRTNTSYHPKIWHGLLISPKLRGNPKFKPPVTLSEIPCRLRIGRGPANKSYSLEWVCLVKKFGGAHSNPRPAVST